MAHSIPALSPAAHAKPSRLDGWAALCVGVYVLLGLALIARVPLMNAPDEVAHLGYIEHVATTRTLPVFQGAAPPDPGYEFHQPPLYYVLAAPAWAALPAGVQQYSARLVSLLCGALTVWLVLASARAMFGAGATARRAGMLAALWPLHIAVGSVASNDALAGLCCAALFWRLALLAGRAPDVRDGVWIGVLCGLGLLSKTTALTVSVAAVLALWHLSRRAFAAAPEQVLAGTSKARIAVQAVATPRVAEVAEPGRVLGVAAGATLVVCGWLLARNTMLYGDALALSVFSAAANAAPTPGLEAFAQGGFAALYFRNLAAIVFATGWGFYGGPDSAWKTMNVFAEVVGRQPNWPQGWLLGAAIVLLAASTYVAVRGLGLGWRVVGRLRSGSGSARDCVLLWCAVAVLLVGLAWLQFALAHFAGAQARYLHAALLPACLLAARAWDDLPPRVRAPLGWIVAGVLLALTLANVLVWRTLV